MVTGTFKTHTQKKYNDSKIFIAKALKKNMDWADSTKISKRDKRKSKKS